MTRMKAALLLVLLLLASPFAARADLTLVSEIESDGQKQEMIMKLKGKDALVNMSEQMSVLLDGKTGDSIMLMHAQKKAMTIPGTSVKAMLAQLQQAQPAAEAAPNTPLKKNGKSETISGYRTQGYDYHQGNIEAEYFLAPDFPDLAATLAQLQSFQQSGTNGLAGGAANIDLSGFPGFPVRTIVKTGGKTITSTVKSVSRDDIPATEFDIPAGYEAASMPLMPGAQP